MTQVGVQRVEFLRGQAMLGSLGRVVEFTKRHTRFICQIPLPQPVGPNDPKRPLFPFRTQVQRCAM
jgi:hypothetical protein